MVDVDEVRSAGHGPASLLKIGSWQRTDLETALLQSACQVFSTSATI